MDLIVVVTFFTVFGWLGVVAWCDLMRPSPLRLMVVQAGPAMLASIRSVVVLDDEMLIELSPEPGRAATRLPRWFTASLAQSSFLMRWRDQRRAVEVIGDASGLTLRRGDEEVTLSVLPDSSNFGSIEGL